MTTSNYQLQFEALITALMRQEWGKGYLLLIELKNTLEDKQIVFSQFMIPEAQSEFMEQEFSFSKQELKESQEVILALEAFLEDQADGLNGHQLK